jgi:hypothetical protein
MSDSALGFDTHSSNSTGGFNFVPGGWRSTPWFFSERTPSPPPKNQKHFTAQSHQKCSHTRVPNFSQTDPPQKASHVSNKPASLGTVGDIISLESTHCSCRPSHRRTSSHPPCRRPAAASPRPPSPSHLSESLSVRALDLTSQSARARSPDPHEYARDTACHPSHTRRRRRRR